MLNNTFAADWTAHPQVKTLITTKRGGYSINEFSSFNLALHVKDNPEHVLQNRKLLEQQLPDKPYWLNQTHSNKVVSLDLINHDFTQNFKQPLQENKPEDELKLETGISTLEYDASFTTIPNKVCAILTADCLPILVTDKRGSFVAAIHAGWRGVENGIIKNTILASDANPQDILIYIGPAICQNHFEVGNEVLERFSDLDPRNAGFFIKSDPNEQTYHKNINKNFTSVNIMNHRIEQMDINKYRCDLAGIAKLQLLNLGLLGNNIFLSNLCTYCRDDLFYSYRKQSITGRFASLIWLK